MKCSPSYHGEPRQDVGNRVCDQNCFHWDACLKELGLPSDYQLRNWVEVLATKEEIKRGLFRIVKKNNKYSRKHPKFKEWDEFVVWKVANTSQ